MHGDTSDASRRIEARLRGQLESTTRALQETKEAVVVLRAEAEGLRRRLDTTSESSSRLGRELEEALQSKQVADGKLEEAAIRVRTLREEHDAAFERRVAAETTDLAQRLAEAEAAARNAAEVESAARRDVGALEAELSVA